MSPELKDQQDPQGQKELESRIRRLCASALATEGPELESVLAELRAALQQHHLELENVITRFLLRLSAKSGDSGQRAEWQNPGGLGRVCQISGD